MYRSTRSTRTALALGGSLALGVATLVAGPTSSAAPAPPPGRVVAHGLNSPRLLSFGPHGALYVAEAGAGGAGPCVTGDTGKVCFGRTGSVTRIGHEQQRRVLSHLPSLAGAKGAEAIGPADVQVLPGGRYVLSIGIAQDIKARHSLGSSARRMGTWVTGRFGHRSRVLADILAFETRANPDHSKAHDSDPTGIVVGRHSVVGTDSGGNTLLRARRHHLTPHVRALAVFPDVTVNEPPPPVGPGGTGPMQAVPTSVTTRHHGAYYVSQLTGFPFPVGAAHIFKVVPGHAPRVWASGLTNVTDLTWSHGRLYAVQIADGGLLNAKGLPMGSLLRVHRGDNKTEDTVAGNLPAPYGVAIRHHAAYVSTCTVCAGGGEVRRIPLS